MYYIILYICVCAFVQSIYIYNVRVGLCLDSLFSFLVTAAFALEQNCIFPWKCPCAESEDPRYGYNVGCNLVYQFPTSQFADAKYYGDPTWHHGKGAAAKLERAFWLSGDIQRFQRPKIHCSCGLCEFLSHLRYSFPGPCYTKSYKEHSEKCLVLIRKPVSREAPLRQRRAPEVCGRAAWWCMPGWTNRQRWLPPAWCFTQCIQKCH